MGMSRSELPAKAEATSRLIVVSDTHGQHAELGELPRGDVLIHCGDILMSARFWSGAGQVQKLQAFNTWLGTVPCEAKVVIAGNHDHVVPTLGREQMAALITNGQYLENDKVNIGGLSLFATPVSRGKSGNAAFQGEEFANEAATAAKAVGEVDVLVTHGPCRTKASADDAGELETWARQLKPKLHCWGHDHAAHGVEVPDQGLPVSVCASIMDTRYCPLQLPIVVDVGIT